MPSTIPVISRMNARVEELSTNLKQCLDRFAVAERFSGPSLHFHRRVIDFRSACSVAEAINSDEFLELLYAVLTAWGMHRMGPGNTKLRDLRHITQALRAHVESIHRLESLKLTSLPTNELQAVATDVWQLIDVLEVSLADAKIVANSKTLHHLLPNIIPPIDRQYTFRFFYNRTNLTIMERDAFFEMFMRFHHIAVANQDLLARLLDTGWNSSETKVLDNALVGYTIDVLNVNVTE